MLCASHPLWSTVALLNMLTPPTCWGLRVAQSHNPRPLHSEDERDDANGLRPSDGVSESTTWEVTVRASFDVCLRRAVGGGRVISREPEERMSVGAAANEIQGTEGVDGWGGPWKKSTRRGRPRQRGRRPGPPFLHEPHCGHALLGQTCSLLSSQRA